MKTSTGISIQVTSDPLDAQWDSFVETSPDGHHLQTSRWAQVKAMQGWAGIRVKAYQAGDLIGGCQLLVRRVAGVTAIGYVPRGPIADRWRGDVLDAVVNGLEQAARAHRVAYLKVQPPVDRWDLCAELAERGYVASDLAPAPETTVRVDVRSDTEEMLGRMAKSTRRNIRVAERKGVTVRVGDEGDFAIFWQTVRATAARQGFEPYPLAYYRRMWELFAPGGNVQLFVAEQGGTPLATRLVVSFGNTVLDKVAGWSGERGAVNPNEALLWGILRWAKEHDYAWFDFEGINPSVAAALRRRGSGEHPPIDRGRAAPRAAPHGLPAASEVTPDGPTRFKLGFGGQVTTFPGASDRAPWPLMGTALRAVARSRSGKLLIHRLLGRRPA